jgi:NET1-associated nuclear protein 1 (U3 small nucleolar RNA-associated protein 17)
MVASLDIPDPAQKSRLIKILRHPISPERLLVLISSSGQIYLYDFIENSIKATYQTDLLITHAVIRNSHTPSSPAAVDRSNTSLTLLLVTKHTPSDSKKAKSKRPPPGTKDKCRERAIVFAVKLEDPSSPNQTNRPLPKIHLLKIDPVSAFSSSPCGNWLGLVTGLNIWIIRLKPTDLFNKVGDQELSKKSKFETLHLSAPEPITCIAFPTKTHADHFDSSQPESIDVSCVPCDFFATGSSSGKIALWHALSEAQWTTFAELATRTPGVALPCPTSLSHWHSHAVADLTFTRNGSHLLSGGEEAVLLLWRLEDFGGMGLDSKTFLPRLGTPISSISLIERVDINEPGALVTGLDGTLMIVNTATMSVSKTLKLPKMYQLPAVYKHSTNPQAVLSPICFPESSQGHIKPYGNLLLQSSHPCGLQILDGGTGRVLSEIFVRPKNTISRRADRPIVEPKLLFAELGGIKDQYLATIDSWVDEERGFSLEITLKLWERVQQGSSNR